MPKPDRAKVEAANALAAGANESTNGVVVNGGDSTHPKLEVSQSKLNLIQVNADISQKKGKGFLYQILKSIII